MDIKFDNNHTDYSKAIQFKKIIRLIEDHHLEEHFESGFLNNLKDCIEEFLNRPEIKKFASENDVKKIEIIQHSGLIDTIKSLFGPGRREKILSKQRIELIERADHAEAIAFEALAETAEVGKQRDEALQQLKELQVKLKDLENAEK